VVVEAGVGCVVGPLGRAPMARLAIGRLDLVFGAAARPDLVGGDDGDDLVDVELLGTGWRLCRWRSGDVYAGGEVRSVVTSPLPLSLFHLGDVLGALVAFSVVRRVVPRRWH
jgi:hypothetical protein